MISSREKQMSLVKFTVVMHKGKATSDLQPSHLLWKVPQGICEGKCCFQIKFSPLCYSLVKTSGASLFLGFVLFERRHLPPQLRVENERDLKHSVNCRIVDSRTEGGGLIFPILSMSSKCSQGQTQSHPVSSSCHHSEQESKDFALFIFQ